MADDYLAAGPAIIERLTALATDAEAVYSTGDVATIALEDMLTPCLYVLYAGDAIQGGDSSRAGSGATQMVAQHWLVVVTVKFELSGEQAAASMAQAGQLIGQVIEALSGWKPGESYRPMRSAGVGEPNLLPGYAEFPMLFETQLITRAAS